ncbi:MAG: protease inhibitor I9 family protein, partial [Desulfosalsimonadaceae bacterium]
EHHEQLAKRAVSAGSVAVIVELRATIALEATLPSAAAVANQRAELTTRQNRVLERLPTPRAREAVAGLKRFHLYPGFAMQASAAELEALLEDPEVEAIHPDRLHTPLLNESLPLIGADEWDTFGGYRGSGQTIAILDTGVDKNH